MDQKALNKLIRTEFEKGESDPHEVSTLVLGQISKSDYLTVLSIVLPSYTRVVAGRQRKSEWSVKPVFVPSSGWKDMSQLTHDECLEVAQEYRNLAEQNLAMAEEFESWANKVSGNQVLGDLKEYKEYLSLRTKEGMRKAKESGRMIGRPGPNQDLVRHVAELRKTMTLQQTADHLNITGVESASGKPWSVTSVFRISARSAE